MSEMPYTPRAIAGVDWQEWEVALLSIASEANALGRRSSAHHDEELAADLIDLRVSLDLSRLGPLLEQLVRVHFERGQAVATQGKE